MTAMEDQTGRYRQRRRTRAAIVGAATQLLQAGSTPSMSEVAELADVSRRTVYLYFPSLEHLLLDATLGALSQAAVEEAGQTPGTDPLAQAEARLVAIAAQSLETLALGRALIRLTVESPQPAAADTPKRGYRRVEWIEQATAPLRARLAPAAYDRLVSALAVVVGWEALVVLEDVRRLDVDEQRATVLWSIRALLGAALAGSPTPREAANRS